MAYFDSPKNRALWDKELENLDAERERRKAEGYKPRHYVNAAEAGKQTERYAGNPKVRRITLKELEDIERQASLAANPGRRPPDRTKARQAAERRHAVYEEMTNPSAGR